MPKISRAIISLSDKTGIAEFAKKLISLGVEILSTGGTAHVLRDNNISVTDISDYTGSPEILDGRLKTLHPKIHGGILGIRGNTKHLEEMASKGIKPIDMVVVNLYPFEATVGKKDCSLEEAIENIDIGGPTMLRAAAKNWQDVAVICDHSDYGCIALELQNNNGALSRETCFKCAQKVFALTARYDAAICNYLNSISDKNKTRFASTLAMTFEKISDLRYGENPHQEAAFYRCSYLPRDISCIANGHQLHGKGLSYNNIMDADAAISLAAEFAEKAAAVIIKHANPCGVAVSEKSISEAFILARDCDPLSAFGGIVALTKPVDEKTAKAIGDTFFEVIVAPKFEQSALDILKGKKHLRLIEIPLKEDGNGEAVTNHIRKIGGGILVQDADNGIEDLLRCKVVTKRSPDKSELEALDFAWKVVKHAKSNAIVISNDRHIAGIGCGQTSRVDSVKIAAAKLQEKWADLKVKALASDAFFPFRDSIDIISSSGVTAIVQPGGSIRDEEVIKACDENNIAMIFTGVRHFRH
ncbi:MAG: bifunctional phosphoribosylaminoimidazolecarboxamide formyltransferase/IMP cyclohydrolase [Deltaproteobacteria bacterium]|nr:bifunctional phosphoribosylaminoimidazolecarboxamide formyltransferase/IMP cyclohydrolase [Deltaproteobacteria bacterium]